MDTLTEKNIELLTGNLNITGYTFSEKELTTAVNILEKKRNKIIINKKETSSLRKMNIYNSLDNILSHRISILNDILLKIN